MKSIQALILPTVLLLGFPSATPPVARAAAPAQDATTSGQVVIEPGLSVGPLKLGDSRERAARTVSQERRRPGMGESLRHHARLGRLHQSHRTRRCFHPPQEREGLPDRIRHHAFPYRRGHHYLRSCRQSRQSLQRSARLYSPQHSGSGARLASSYSGSTKRKASPSSSPTIRKNTSATFSKRSFSNPTRLFVRKKNPVTSSKWQAIPAYSLEPPPKSTEHKLSESASYSC